MKMATAYNSKSMELAMWTVLLFSNSFTIRIITMQCPSFVFSVSSVVICIHAGRFCSIWHIKHIKQVDRKLIGVSAQLFLRKSRVGFIDLALNRLLCLSETKTSLEDTLEISKLHDCYWYLCWHCIGWSYRECKHAEECGVLQCTIAVVTIITIIANEKSEESHCKYQHHGSYKVNLWWQDAHSISDNSTPTENSWNGFGAYRQPQQGEESLSRCAHQPNVLQCMPCRSRKRIHIPEQINILFNLIWFSIYKAWVLWWLP